MTPDEAANRNATMHQYKNLLTGGMITSRRDFGKGLAAILAAGSAPAICKAALLGARGVAFGGKVDIVPSDYSRISSVHTGDGNGAFWTGMYAKNQLTYKFKIAKTNAVSNRGIAFYANGSNGYIDFRTSGYVGPGPSVSYGQYKYTVGVPLEFLIVCSGSRIGTYVNGTKLTSSDVYYHASNQILFMGIQASYSAMNFYGDVYSFQVFPKGMEDGDMLMNCIPVKRKADNKVGFYEPISKRFIYRDSYTVGA